MTVSEIKKIIKEKVEGIWIEDHDASGHYYKNTKTGIRVASITTKQKIIEKPHLKAWAIKKGIEWIEVGDRFEKLKGSDRNLYMTGALEAHTEESGEASSAGTLCHCVLENYIKYYLEKGVYPDDIKKGFKNGADPQAIAGARAFEKELKNKDIIPIASELLVGSEKLNSAGTLDFLCFMDGKLTLGDFKLTNGIDDGYACQTAAYKYMFEEMTGLKIKQIKIFQLSKNYDKVNRYRVTNPRSAFKALKGLSTFYDWDNNNKIKIEKDIIRIDLTKHGHNKTRTTRGTPLTREGDSVKD